MKTYLCVIIFIVLGVGQASSNYMFGHNYGYDLKSDKTEGDHSKDHQVDNVDHSVHDNKDDDVKKPCSYDDLKCIRRFLVYYFKCYPVYGPAPDPYIMSNVPMDFPHANLTMTLIDAHVLGLNTGTIKEFYVNKKSKTLVLEVVFEKLVVDTPKTLVTYYRKGKEPIKVIDLTLIEFRYISLTLTTSIYDMNLHNSYVYTYLPEQKPLIQVGPGLLRINKEALDMTWLNNIELSVREAFIEVGPIYLSAFMGSKICDFWHH